MFATLLKTSSPAEPLAAAETQSERTFQVLSSLSSWSLVTWSVCWPPLNIHRHVPEFCGCRVMNLSKPQLLTSYCCAVIVVNSIKICVSTELIFLPPPLCFHGKLSKKVILWTTPPSFFSPLALVIQTMSPTATGVSLSVARANEIQPPLTWLLHAFSYKCDPVCLIYSHQCLAALVPATHTRWHFKQSFKHVYCLYLLKTHVFSVV